MAAIIWLVSRLIQDFPDLTFVPSTDFHWSPTDRTIYYEAESDDAAALLHETAHAILGHTIYRRDIELIAMERDAWTHAQSVLAARYGLTIDNETIDSSLESYRDWLHARSQCPTCTAVGLQVDESDYQCLACLTAWRVNEARLCALRRYVNK